MKTLDLEQIEQAHARIKEEVRRTPCLRARFFRDEVHAAMTLKLESLQVTGSFKARGASATVQSLTEAERHRGLVTASGGNHGLGVAYAGWRVGAPVHVYLPNDTPAAKARKLERWGATVHLSGSVWDEANQTALATAERDGMTYLHPFADPRVMAGQGTIGIEILKQAASTDTVIVSVGGGGLISGVATALKSLKPEIRVIGVEPVGAPTMSNSIKLGAVTALELISTEASSLAPKNTTPLNFDIARRYVDQWVLVNDEQMREAAQWLWFEMGIGTELSGAAACAALRTGGYQPAPDENVCAIVCGAGTDGGS